MGWSSSLSELAVKDGANLEKRVLKNPRIIQEYCHGGVTQSGTEPGVILFILELIEHSSAEHL